MSVRSRSSYAYMMETLCRNRKVDSESLRPDLFTEIAGPDFAAVLDFDGRDVGADGADVIGDGFSEQRACIVGGADDRGIQQLGRPALLCGAVDHDAVPGAVGGHHRRSRDPDFLLFERRGHSAASISSKIIWLRLEWRQGA